MERTDRILRPTKSIGSYPDPMREGDAPHVLIVADNASTRFGGEPFLPLQYFTRLTARGVPTWMVCHERVRPELEEYLEGQVDRVAFVRDTGFDRAMWRLGQKMPYKASAVTTQVAMQLETQVRVRRTVRALVRQHSISVVHQPTPVSPKQPSALWGLGAPLVIGPMNGGMTFPKGLRHRQHRSERLAVAVTRTAASVANRLLPGKRRAALLLVANQRTKDALPRSVRRTKVEQLVENGVDLHRFQRPTDADLVSSADPVPNSLSLSGSATSAHFWT